MDRRGLRSLSALASQSGVRCAPGFLGASPFEHESSGRSAPQTPMPLRTPAAMCPATPSRLGSGGGSLRREPSSPEVEFYDSETSGDRREADSGGAPAATARAPATRGAPAATAHAPATTAGDAHTTTAPAEAAHARARPAAGDILADFAAMESKRADVKKAEKVAATAEAKRQLKEEKAKTKAAEKAAKDAEKAGAGRGRGRGTGRGRGRPKAALPAATVGAGAQPAAQAVAKARVGAGAQPAAQAGAKASAPAPTATPARVAAKAVLAFLMLL